MARKPSVAQGQKNGNSFLIALAFQMPKLMGTERKIQIAVPVYVCFLQDYLLG